MNMPRLKASATDDASWSKPWACRSSRGKTRRNRKVTTRGGVPSLVPVHEGEKVQRMVTDIHGLEGRRLFSAASRFPFERGLDGHSDADVVIHAIMDALLGAAQLATSGRIFR